MQINKYVKTSLQNIKSINLTHKTYNTTYSNTQIRLIEDNALYKGLTIKRIETTIHTTIIDIKFDYEIFREAYINQRKQYKLLKAYLALKDELISENEYDDIEDECMITIRDYNENISKKAIYRFLKNHNDYVQDYDSNELSEILGISYQTVNKIIKNRNQ